MRFLHLADLHLGKRLREYDLFFDQEKALDEAIDLATKEKLDAIVVSGDVYDNSSPSSKAITLLDHFLTKSFNLNIPVLMISGNHDSEDKLHYVSGILLSHNINIVTDIKEPLKPITIKGVNFYLLPYFNYQEVNKVFDQSFTSLSEAASFLIQEMKIDKKEQNVLLLHQSVLPLSGHLLLGGSEIQPEANEQGEVGGSDTIPSSIFKDFDYVALGHIHKSMNVAKNMRYPGALLKYHEDEWNDKKSFTVVNIDNKETKIEEFPIDFLHDVVRLTGSLDEICSKEEYKNCYVFAMLEEKDYLEEPMAKLKAHFPYAAALRYAPFESKEEEKTYENPKKIDKKTLFSDFYKYVTGTEIEEELKPLINEEIAKAWKEEK